MNLLQLKYFMILAQHEHLTKAAEIANISEPAMSIMLSRLEKELGHRIFDREGRKIKLNESGKAYYQYISQALSLIEDGRNAVNDIHEKSNQFVTIAATSTRVLNEVLREYSGFRPDMKINMRRIKTFEVSDYLNNSETDFVLSAAPLADNSKYESSFLFEEDLVLVVNENHPFANRKCIDLVEAKDEKFLMLYRGYALREDSDYLCKLAGFEPKIVMECDHDIRMTMLLTDFGITFSSQSTVWYGGSFPSTAVFVNISNPIYKRRLYLTWNNKRYRSSAAKLFKQFITNYCYTKLNNIQEVTGSKPASPTK